MVMETNNTKIYLARYRRVEGAKVQKRPTFEQNRGQKTISRTIFHGRYRWARTMLAMGALRTRSHVPTLIL